jgi:hypothetical protein
MEQSGQGPYSTLYNRYDSTAIDTTLTKPEGTSEYPPAEPDYGWYGWGRPRGYTRWGFDFDRFDPSYYWSYYGYYDYYSRPWWYSYNDPYWGGWYPGYYGGNGVAGEPPSKRPVGRRDRTSGSGSYGSPSTAPAPGAPNISSAPAATPQSGGTPAPQTPPSNGGEAKRDGKRGR